MRLFVRLILPCILTILCSLTSQNTAQAKPSCSNATLNGGYGLHATGAAGAGRNFAVVGRFTFDGKGNLTGTLFVRVAGNDVELHITGTYSVGGDCTVDDTWNFSGASSTHKSVIVDGGAGYFILNNTSGDGSVISGTARKQSGEDEDDD
jgi:hypothetical protein